MVKVPLQKLDKLVDVHCLLDHSKLSLEASVLGRLLKGEHAMLRNHPQQSRVDSGPILSVWLAQHQSFGHDSFGLDAHLFL
jgi:hypothetical protein